MKPLFIATLGALFATAAAAGDVTVSFANGTSRIFDSVTVYAMAAGEVGDDALGGINEALRPGESATVKLALTKCQPVFVQAVWGENGVATTEADSCDPAIFTLTE
jgi:hypothetical protein